MILFHNAAHHIYDSWACVDIERVFLPLGSNLPFYKRPVASLAWAAVCIFLFLFVIRDDLNSKLSAAFEATFVYQWSILPQLGNSLINFFSYQFLHASFSHLIANVWYLMVFGFILENALGPWAFIIFSLSAGALAVIPEIWIQSGQSLPIVGASGAVAFMMGAAAFMFPRAKIRFLFLLIPLPNAPSTFFVPIRYLVYFWLFLQFSGLAYHSLISPKPVAYATHLGGFLLGALLGLVYRQRKQFAFEEVDLSGEDLRSFYRGLKAIHRNEIEKAKFEFQSLSDRHPWLSGLQRQLMDVCIRFRQTELFDSLWKEDRFEHLKRSRPQDLIKILDQYRAQFQELPRINMQQSVWLLEMIKSRSEYDGLAKNLVRHLNNLSKTS